MLQADSGASGGNERGRVSQANPPPDWVIRIVNPLLALLLRSPLYGLVSEGLVLLTVTGRKSGADYTFPVGYERRDDTLYVTSHGANWWKNLRDGDQRVTVLLQGTERTGRAEVVEDDAAVAECLHEYFERKGLGVARRVGLDVEGSTVPDEETLRDAVDHVVLVRIDLDGS